MISTTEEMVLIGTPIGRGIAIGYPYFLISKEDAHVEWVITADEVEGEIKRYQLAKTQVRNEIKKLQKNLQNERAFDAADILDAHLQMLEDPLLNSHVEDLIGKQKKNVDTILKGIIDENQEKFNSIQDSFFKERFKDIQDLSRRIAGYLRKGCRQGLADIPQDSIVFANDLTAFDTAEANSGCVLAFVTKAGGATSHAAIVAKAKGIPFVSSVNINSLEEIENTLVIVDGRTGELILHPHTETVEKYRKLRSQLNVHMQKLKQAGQLEAETYDGYKVLLSANVEQISELDLLHQYGGNGVGLLRTEAAFLGRESYPNEEEQFNNYRLFVEKMNGLPIVIRTFDLGGDKYLCSQPQVQECNPFLGCRAIRFSLREKELFKIQLRAILRTSAFGDVSLMFPMVCALSELLEAKAILKETKEELQSEGYEIANHIPVGCMIEVPSAAIISDLLAKECDFLSIGTNDLVQYALAVDRNNHVLSDLYSPAHPSVIRLIKLVVNEANHHGIPVSVCGEVAADPRFAPLLLGLGVHELSVASRHLPIVKNAIRNISIVSASRLAEQALKLSSVAEIEELLNREYRQNVPEDCFYNC